MPQNSLAPILAAWKLKTGGEELLFRPTVSDRGGRPDLGTSPGFMRPHTLIRHLREALKTCGLPSLTWCEATRHTFASLFVLGGSLEMLRTLMGHNDRALQPPTARPVRRGILPRHGRGSFPTGGRRGSTSAGPGKSQPQNTTTRRDTAEKKLAQLTETRTFGPVAQVDRAAVS